MVLKSLKSERAFIDPKSDAKHLPSCPFDFIKWGVPESAVYSKC